MLYSWKGRSNPKEYGVSTWSNKTGYTRFILRYGTVVFLKEPSNRNKGGKNKKQGGAAGGGLKRECSSTLKSYTT